MDFLFFLGGGGGGGGRRLPAVAEGRGHGHIDHMPWPPELPAPPWPLLSPEHPPRWYCYGAGRAFMEGEVMSVLC